MSERDNDDAAAGVDMPETNGEKAAHRAFSAFRLEGLTVVGVMLVALVPLMMTLIGHLGSSAHVGAQVAIDGLKEADSTEKEDREKADAELQRRLEAFAKESNEELRQLNDKLDRVLLKIGG